MKFDVFLSVLFKYILILHWLFYKGICHKPYAKKNVSEKISIKLIQKKSLLYVFNASIMLRKRHTKDLRIKNVMAFHLKFNILQIIMSLSERVASRTQVQTINSQMFKSFWPLITIKVLYIYNNLKILVKWFKDSMCLSLLCVLAYIYVFLHSTCKDCHHSYYLCY